MITRDQTSQALQKYQSGATLTGAETRLMNRHLEVDNFTQTRCLFAEVQPDIMAAVEEVLTRLPDEIIEVFEERETFIVFPARTACFATSLLCSVPSFRLVILAEYLHRYNHRVVVGVIVHELAHTFRGDITGGQAVEEATDALASEWGFADEIKESRSVAPK